MQVCVKDASFNTSFPRCSRFFDTSTQTQHQLFKELRDSLRLNSSNSGLNNLGLGLTQLYYLSYWGLPAGESGRGGPLIRTKHTRVWSVWHKGVRAARSFMIRFVSRSRVCSLFVRTCRPTHTGAGTDRDGENGAQRPKDAEGDRGLQSFFAFPVVQCGVVCARCSCPSPLVTSLLACGVCARCALSPVCL